MAKGIIEKGRNGLFENEIELTGKYATMARFLKEEIGIFSTLREAYVTSAIVGFINNRNESEDNEPPVKAASIFASDLSPRKKDLRFIYVLIKTTDEGMTDYFTRILENLIPSITIAKISKLTREGDLAAILSGLNENDYLLCSTKCLELNDKTQKVLKDAVKEYVMRVPIGSGPGSREVILDIAKFSMIICVEEHNEVIDELIDCFDYIIDCNNDDIKTELCTKLINEELELYDYDENVIQYLAEVTQRSLYKCKKICKKICDYMMISAVESKHINIGIVKTVLDLMGFHNINNI